MNYRDTIGYGNEAPVPKLTSNASLEAMLKAMLARGMVAIQGKCTLAVPHASIIDSTDLAGYGTNFFITNFYMQVIVSAGAAANEVRKILGYSTTGTFVTDAFSAVVTAGDQLLIIHESLVAVGRNDANNVFDSALVVANADGSILERLEDIKDHVHSGDNIEAEVIGLPFSKSIVSSLTAADATGTENELFSHVPIGVAKPQTLKINLDNMVAGDVIAVRLYYRYASEGGWIQEDYQPYAGIDGGLANGSKSISVKLDPNPYGVRVTLAQTSGTARAFGWFVVIDE
jgi:hypothetical protein